ncbi:MAG: DUF1080 domain-containing protein [Planctomycetes bacterium]|nr:DUF1080 domain-containing protein [Planctomycetota bacterium]
MPGRAPLLPLLLLSAAAGGCCRAEGGGMELLLSEANSQEWRVEGGATFSWEDGALYGRDAGDRNSFLISPRDYSDFVLECQLKIESGGNSGIQVRSHQKPDGTVFGYQIEVDPSERAWSGGLYDESRRGWLDPLDDQPEARAAFRVGEWNRFRIECRGDRIRSWVNGVPCTDFQDSLDASGRIAFQVHGGQGTHVRWRDIRLQELGAED